MSHKLLQAFPCSAPSPAITAIWNSYSEIFSRIAMHPECIGQEALTIDCREVLVEVPLEKQGIHPSKQQYQNNWNRGHQPSKSQSGMPKRVDMKVFQDSGLSDDINRKAWYYQDEDKKTQGPFSSKDMDTLLSKNIVDSQTRVALDSLEKFVRIEKIIKVYQQAQATQATQQQQPAVQQIQQQTSAPPQTAVVAGPKIQKHDIKEPFKNSLFASSLETKLWFYQSQPGETVGPLSTNQMDELWADALINEEVKVAFETQEKFVRVEKIIKIAEEQIAKEAAQKLAAEKAEDSRQEERKQHLYNKLGGQQLWEGGSAVKVIATVTSSQRNTKGNTKQRQNEKSGSYANKSMQVEGQHGNVYEKREVPAPQKITEPVVVQPVQAVQPIEPIQQVAPQKTEPKKAEPKKAEPKKAEPKKAEPKKAEPKKVEVKQEQAPAPSNDFQEEEDEWQSVTPQGSNKKKYKNLIPNAQSVPGLQTKVQPRGQAQPAKKQPVPVVVTSQPVQEAEDDEWTEVVPKKK